MKTLDLFNIICCVLENASVVYMKKNVKFKDISDAKLCVLFFSLSMFG